MIHKFDDIQAEENHSFWLHKYGNYRPEPSLKGDISADVVIIGGGFTGLTTAREVMRDSPAARVVVLEAMDIGFGSSGRNGGFSMSLFGFEPEVTMLRWGRQKTIEAQAYMNRAVSYVKDLVDAENLQSDYEHPGMVRVAYSEKQLTRLKKNYDLLCDLVGGDHYHFMAQGEIQGEIHSDKLVGAIYEAASGILDPCRHVRELKGLALSAGAQIYENSPVVEICRGAGSVTVKTNGGSVTADKLVLATNAWSHALPINGKVARSQKPVWTHQIVTDPLSEEEWKQIGWGKRYSLEDNRQMIHYSRLTTCGRITMGGGTIGLGLGKKMQGWRAEDTWRSLEAHLKWMLPQLAHKKVYYRWGGPVSVNLDMVPEIGFIGDERIIYATGCMGHGVSLTQLNGRLIADLLQNKQSDLTDFWIVNRSAIPIPGWGVNGTIQWSARAILQGMDAWEEKSLKRT